MSSATIAPGNSPLSGRCSKGPACLRWKALSMKVRRRPSRSPSAAPPKLAWKPHPCATPRLIASAYMWSCRRTSTRVPHGSDWTATRMSSAMRKAKLAAHQYVGRRKPMRTSPSSNTSISVTKPSSVTDSSSSGSITVARQACTCATRSGITRAAAIASGRHRDPLLGEQALLRGDVDAVQPRRIQTEDLLLGFEVERHAALAGDGVGQFECHESIDEPVRRPDAVVAAVEELVRAQPHQQLRDHVSKILRLLPDERQRHSEATVDV